MLEICFRYKFAIYRFDCRCRLIMHSLCHPYPSSPYWGILRDFPRALQRQCRKDHETGHPFMSSYSRGLYICLNKTGTSRCYDLCCFRSCFAKTFRSRTATKATISYLEGIPRPVLINRLGWTDRRWCGTYAAIVILYLILISTKQWHLMPFFELPENDC